MRSLRLPSFSILRSAFGSSESPPSPLSRHRSVLDTRSTGRSHRAPHRCRYCRRAALRVDFQPSPQRQHLGVLLWSISRPATEPIRTARTGHRLRYSKDHRPDLKQLPFILTTDRPTLIVAFRGNSGPPTATPTTQLLTLRPGTPCGPSRAAPTSCMSPIPKLSRFDNLDYIRGAGGRLVTVMPRSCHEDGHLCNFTSDQHARLAARVGWAAPTLS
jgi:hypothetical protein